MRQSRGARRHTQWHSADHRRLQHSSSAYRCEHRLAGAWQSHSPSSPFPPWVLLQEVCRCGCSQSALSLGSIVVPLCLLSLGRLGDLHCWLSSLFPRGVDLTPRVFFESSYLLSLVLLRQCPVAAAEENTRSEHRSALQCLSALNKAGGKRGQVIGADLAPVATGLSSSLYQPLLLANSPPTFWPASCVKVGHALQVCLIGTS